MVVSLSRTRKVPLLFSKLSSNLSESRRVIFPKYHLMEAREKKKNRTHGSRLVRGREDGVGNREGTTELGVSGRARFQSQSAVKLFTFQFSEHAHAYRAAAAYLDSRVSLT